MHVFLILNSYFLIKLSNFAPAKNDNGPFVYRLGREIFIL